MLDGDGSELSQGERQLLAIARAAIADPPLSSILPPCRLIAHEALRLISVSASSKHWLPAHTAYPPQLVQRESTSGPRFGSSDMALPDDES